MTRTEGARSGLVIGTYAHGPALARNPSLADLLLAWATGSVPAPLDDVEERALRAQRLEAVGARGWRQATTAPADAVRRMRDLVKARRSSARRDRKTAGVTTPGRREIEEFLVYGSAPSSATRRDTAP